MVDVDTFLTTVYVLVDEVCQQEAPPDARTAGPAAALSRSEVITLALFAQWQPFSSERAFYRYALRHLRPLFPRLPDRSQFNRQVGRQLGSIVAVGQAVARQIEQVVCAQQRAGGHVPMKCSTAWGSPPATASGAAGAAGWARSRRLDTATGWAGRRASICSPR